MLRNYIWPHHILSSPPPPHPPRTLQCPRCLKTLETHLYITSFFISRTTGFWSCIPYACSPSLWSVWILTRKGSQIQSFLIVCLNLCEISIIRHFSSFDLSTVLDLCTLQPPSLTMFITLTTFQNLNVWVRWLSLDLLIHVRFLQEKLVYRI